MDGSFELLLLLDGGAAPPLVSGRLEFRDFEGGDCVGVLYRHSPRNVSCDAHGDVEHVIPIFPFKIPGLHDFDEEGGGPGREVDIISDVVLGGCGGWCCKQVLRPLGCFGQAEVSNSERSRKGLYQGRVAVPVFEFRTL